jgi:chemotaxis protein methyltransferase CheR
LIDRRRKTPSKTVRIQIWSAACSTGQEVYSIAIALKELLGDTTAYDIQILGTDISDRVLTQASYGEFSQMELERGLPPEKLSRYFNRHGDRWRIKDELRALAVFRPMNLLLPFSFPLPFDIIFCRNVAIYFNEQDKTRLFGNLRKNLAIDGSLIIGSTESLASLCPELESKRYLRSVFYQIKI